jgi:protease YdgD
MKKLLLLFLIIFYTGSVYSKEYNFTGVGLLDVASKKTCTATLVSPDTVLTAAHCVFDVKSSRYYPPKYIQFKPYTKNNDADYIGVKTYTVGMKGVPKGNFTQDDLMGDWALITLKQKVDCSLNRLSLLAQEKYNNHTLVVAGYPKGSHNQLISDGSCEFALKPTKGKMLRLKNCSLKHGESGAPLMVLIDGKLKVIGTISAGVNDSKGRYRVFAVPSDSFTKKVAKLSQTCEQ